LLPSQILLAKDVSAGNTAVYTYRTPTITTTWRRSEIVFTCTNEKQASRAYQPDTEIWNKNKSQTHLQHLFTITYITKLNQF
jgi:hypothetical protein